MPERSWRSHPWLLGTAGVLVVLVLWTAITATGLVDKLFLPSPAAVWSAGQVQAQQGLLWRDFSASVGRVFGGFALSAIVALPLGIAMAAAW